MVLDISRKWRSSMNFIASYVLKEYSIGINQKLITEKKRIRRHLHLDYYYGNMTADEADREARHMDHCLEYWREAAMCRGDPTLTTFIWNEGRPFSKVHSTHECVNWSRLRQWAESRMVDTSDLSIFSHSNLQPHQ
ncbi:hypothetical protein AAE478_008707 [Parahypoxylon ruwenzoriense]